MNKVKITVDTMLQIINEIFNADDVNSVISDTTVPNQWQGKTINECLNVEYYTFKHKSISSQQLIQRVLDVKKETNELLALDRSYCLLSISGIERQYSKDIDMIGVDIALEYWIQSHKIKLLEWLIESCNIQLSGLRIPVVIGNQTRQAVIIFGNPQVGEIRTTSQIGESAIVDITVTMLLYPDAVSYCDYELSFVLNGEQTKPLPLSSFGMTNTMSQKGVPTIQDTTRIGQLNVSASKSFNLVFDGYNHPFVDYLSTMSLGTTTDNNSTFGMRIQRQDEEYTFECVVSSHTITVANDTNNEVHQVTITTKPDIIGFGPSRIKAV